MQTANKRVFKFSYKLPLGKRLQATKNAARKIPERRSHRFIR